MRISVRFDATGHGHAFDGASDSVVLRDVSLHVPFAPDIAKYMMGFGRHGRRLAIHEAVGLPLIWHWEEGSGAHMVWVGDLHGGMRVKLSGPSEAWDSPLHRVSAEELKTLSWHNHGDGYAAVDQQGQVHVHTGALKLTRGKPLELNFELLLTPCQPLRPRMNKHWHERYTQQGYPAANEHAVSDIARRGANVVNYHQGLGVNPYINYPFVRRAIFQLRQRVEHAHAHGLRAKAYYTIRELSNHAAELWVLRSLGDEVLRGGPGMTGDTWLMEHLMSGYTACWMNPIDSALTSEYDAAVCNKGLSRWANYYVEGLAELVRVAGIDGLYYDGIDFGIETIRRVRAVLSRERGDKGLLDLHSGNNNHPNDNGKYGSVSPALQYMGVLPHIDSVWFGEGFDYFGEMDDYWLVEVSGLAFGVTGDLMCTSSTYQGPAPWRGMLYGSMGRDCTYGRKDGFPKLMARPSALWRLIDTLGIDRSQMQGYWDATASVTLQGCADVRATSYVRRGKLTLVVLASWTSPRPTWEATDQAAAERAATDAMGNGTHSWNRTESREGYRRPHRSAIRGGAPARLLKLIPSGSRDILAGAKWRKGISAVRDNCSLAVDWSKIGLAPERAVAFAPMVLYWQDSQTFEIGQTAERLVGPIPVTAWRGRFVVLADKAEAARLPPELRQTVSMQFTNEMRHERVLNEMSTHASGPTTAPRKSRTIRPLQEKLLALQKRVTSHPGYDLENMKRHGSHVRAR